MPCTKHQLSIPSHNIPLTDPVWVEATLDETLRVLVDVPGMTRTEADRQFCDVVRLAILEEACEYGPLRSTQDVLWTYGRQIIRYWRMRPGSGYAPKNVGTPEELPGENGSPAHHDARGLAIQLGKEAAFDDALAAARAIADKDAGPKAVRLGIKARLAALKDEISGAAAANRARRKPPEPVGAPDGDGGRP